MPFYMKLGNIPRKRHMAHRHVPGHRGEGIYYEEVVTTGGFGKSMQTGERYPRRNGHDRCAVREEYL